MDFRLRDGTEGAGRRADDYAWKHEGGLGDIIAFRLSPTAPVEASGSEDLARKLTAIRDKFLMPTPDKDFTDYAIITRCIEALRPQRGETREIVEEWAAMARRATPPTGCLLRYVPISEGEINAIEALLSARPLALGGQHSGGEWRCEDCGAQADEWFDCCKNPARAEAQDEGAAGEPVAYRQWCQSDKPHQGGWWQLIDKHDGDHAIATGGGKSLRPLYAHPSPTPSADADRVRIAVEALEPFAAFAQVAEAKSRMALGKVLSDEEILASISWEGGLGVLVMGHFRDALSLVPKPKGWSGLYRRSKALAALKSTAAKEGGEV